MHLCKIVQQAGSRAIHAHDEDKKRWTQWIFGRNKQYFVYFANIFSSNILWDLYELGMLF